MNIKIKNLIIKIAIPLILIGICIGVERFLNTKAEDLYKKPVIVMDDPSKIQVNESKPIQIINKKEYGNLRGIHDIFGFYGENEFIAGIGITREEFDKKYTKKTKEKMDDMFKDIYGKLYKVKLDSLKKEPIKVKNNNINVFDTDCRVYLSKDMRNLIWHKNEKTYVYNIKNKKVSECKFIYANSKEDSKNDFLSKDGNCIIRYSYDKGVLEVYNINNCTSKSVSISKKSRYISILDYFYSENGTEVYFAGEEKGNKGYDRRQGVYKVNMNSKQITTIMLLPYVDRTKKNFKENCIPGHWHVLDNGNKLLADIMLNGEDGTFIYDVQENKYHKVVSHIKVNEGAYGVPCCISPDETKVVYMNLSNESGKDRWNLYVANIRDNRFTNVLCLEKSLELGGMFFNRINWSNDSKKIIYLKSTESKYSRNKFIEFNDEFIVTMVTFK